MADIWDFFENMDELVYVSDMDTYNMVYMNRRAMAQYSLTSPEQYQNRKCYELLQSCSSPCAMCTNSKLCPGEFFEWSRYNPIVKRAYILKDTMVIRTFSFRLKACIQLLKACSGILTRMFFWGNT